jgi:hypothetical protein
MHGAKAHSQSLSQRLPRQLRKRGPACALSLHPLPIFSTPPFCAGLIHGFDLV